jgi:hypothetical protein
MAMLQPAENRWRALVFFVVLDLLSPSNVRYAMLAKSATANKPGSLWAFIDTLASSRPTSVIADDPPWFPSGQVCEIDETTYWFFLELLPPRWMNGNWFAYGEGTGPFRLFWQVQNCYFVRELSSDETRTFCRLSGISIHL